MNARSCVGGSHQTCVLQRLQLGSYAVGIALLGLGYIYGKLPVDCYAGFARYSLMATVVRYADINLVRLPETMSFVDVASMACRYMAAFHGIVDQANVRGGEWVVVHGAGGMGLSAAQIAVALGGKVIAVDVSSKALAAARELGAVYTINSGTDKPVETIRTLTNGGAQVSIDALGIAETCANSVLSLRKLGRHIQLGHTTRKEAGYVPLPSDVILLNELRLFGAFGMQGQRYGTMPVKKLQSVAGVPPLASEWDVTCYRNMACR